MHQIIIKPKFLTYILVLHFLLLSQLLSFNGAEQSSSKIQYELNSGWVCKNIQEVKITGEELSKTSYQLKDWMQAKVPGTVLTSLLENKLIPDPFYGMNNKKIQDIYYTGRDHYTYWFVKEFNEKVSVGNEQVWLNFRGVNYGCDIFLNGQKLNESTHYGMFLRQTYNITSFLSDDGNNRLAVIVYPPDPVGNPNGGQGGDGTIGRNITNQYVAGWDWIQPVRDRNTGIWDKVTIEKTNSIKLVKPHVITLVPGKRFPEKTQKPAIIKSSITINNPTPNSISGNLYLSIDNAEIKKEVQLLPNSSQKIHLSDFTLTDPKLWWPNGYGEQTLYKVNFKFISNLNILMDEVEITTGIREIQTKWNERTRSREILVNGQKIFIKGGNWIISDAMLRFSPERYNAEVRFHRDMNLNLIRIWGGAITERPEFYNACDKYGILVMQDFWMSGDCNGKWLDPKKKEDQWTRRKYPDDHKLFLKSVADQVSMIRNHPSLAFYCGGNEIPPPQDILTVMVDSLLPALDSTRYFFEYSNADSMSHNSIGGNGDGPYHIQNINTFWEKRTFPFNSEIGSIGIGDYQSLERFIPEENLVLPGTSWRDIDSVWRYHKTSWYGNFIERYGTPTDLNDFASKAQLVNYNQYRGLMEGHISHMWDWYTGVIIWKTQNPWTALRGQMYDYYLDPNGGLYGLNNANKSIHAMYNPVDGMLTVANHTFNSQHDLMIQAKAIDFTGKDSLIFQWFIEVTPTSVQKIESIKRTLDKLYSEKGGFLSLRLLSSNQNIIDDNLYWFPDSSGNYSGLQQMAKSNLEVKVRKEQTGKIEVKLVNPKDETVAFFNRISLVDRKTKKRILPSFYSDNYISVLPGEEKIIFIDHKAEQNDKELAISISGWNVDEQYFAIE
ncbi:MAG: glycosyl hydrolase [Ignavibacteriales bacterium]|nr:glycosyl hydrolase [Ignavibacteriales bacterium]